MASDADLRDLALGTRTVLAPPQASYATRLGDAAVIEGVMRTTEPHERSMHVRNFYNRLYTRERYLKNYLSHSPAWCAAHVAGVGTAIPNHFLHVERVQAAAAAGKSIAEYSPLLQSAAKHDRYFPGLDDVVDDAFPQASAAGRARGPGCSPSSEICV